MCAFGTHYTPKRRKTAEKPPTHRAPGEASTSLPGLRGSDTGLRGKPAPTLCSEYRALGEEYRASGEARYLVHPSSIFPRPASRIAPSAFAHFPRTARKVYLRFKVFVHPGSADLGSMTGTNSCCGPGRPHIWGLLCWAFHVCALCRGRGHVYTVKLTFRYPDILRMALGYRASGEGSRHRRSLPWQPGIQQRRVLGFGGRLTGPRGKDSGLWGKRYRASGEIIPGFGGNLLEILPANLEFCTKPVVPLFVCC
jgi:hypothetical protein